MGRKRVRGLVASAIVVGAVFLGGTAFAHYVYGSGYVYVSGVDCTWIRSEVSHGSGNGYYKGNVEIRKNVSSNCSNYWSRPANNVRLHLNGMKKSGSTWAACWGTSPYWKYNTSSAYKLESFVRPSSAPACGTGTYRTDTFGDGYNGGWHGGIVVSNSGHTLPT